MKDLYRPWGGLFPHPTLDNQKEPEPRWQRVKKVREGKKEDQLKLFKGEE